MSVLTILSCVLCMERPVVSMTIHSNFCANRWYTSPTRLWKVWFFSISSVVLPRLWSRVTAASTGRCSRYVISGFGIGCSNAIHMCCGMPLATPYAIPLPEYRSTTNVIPSFSFCLISSIFSWRFCAKNSCAEYASHTSS